MRVKPTEVKLVVELLEQPSPDVHALAEDIIRTLNEARLEGAYYYFVPRQPQDYPFFAAYGPSTTRAETEKKALASGLPGTHFRVIRTHPYREWNNPFLGESERA